MDVARARERSEAVRGQLAVLEQKLQDEIDRVAMSFDPQNEPLAEVTVQPRAQDISLKLFGLVWLPFRRDTSGSLAPDWR
jgi:hypothetical protein